ncbi:patatin-like phospholipase family protein [Polymorphobacter sp. PAMC 29334]|uniref:patatin-like phospholipase family protein n=1 Tax=Polymorphobacter sp. PAMC 29334 TaxID=2862331 RepID=UPI001C74556A|nr:patatin-like phospholipase family protein [Polymorphobacter sp. PAMC 29334]QYE36220.1 patatin-like phospholipase family protein [Polymorphobacter sp. PAMC 29334]
MKRALALGGGAGLGWAHIGVLRELTARGVTIDAIAGTSIGAIAAVCLAADRLGVLEDLARSTGGRQVMRYIDVDLRRGSLLGGRAVARELLRHFGHAELQDLFIPCAVVAADLITGHEVVMTRGSVVEAVRASIAIPGIFPPLRRGGQVLVDGGVVTPVPVRAVRALSTAPVIAINLQGDYLRRAEKGLPARLRILTPMRVGRAGISLLLAELARKSLLLDPPDLELALPVGHFHVRNFTKANELIDIGAAAVAEAWPEIVALDA